MNDIIDTALIAAIKASTTEPTKKKIIKSCQLVAFVSDDEPVRAAADKSQYVPFTKYLNTRAAVAA
jgi:hypothetical protein